MATCTKICFAAREGPSLANEAAANRSVSPSRAVHTDVRPAKERGGVMRFPSRGFTDSLLFLSSFAPLFLALALRFDDTTLRIVCGVLCFLGALALLAILNLWVDRTPMTIVVASADDRGPDVGGYIAAYLMPLVAVPKPTAADLAAYVMILLVIGLVYVRSRMIQMNPLLYLLGLRLYTITTLDGFRGYLISSDAPVAGDEIKVARRDNILLAVNDAHGG